jgi:hypothetical protein
MRPVDSKDFGAMLKIVNLEHGLPKVEQARARLRTELDTARREGVTALKIIHGYGSHGVGGELRIALQASLATWVREGEIQAFIAGEEWRVSNEIAWNLLQRLPGLKRDPDLGRGNKGITIAVL